MSVEMSFNNKNFWLNGESISLNDGMMTVQTSSKSEQKRSQQWDIPVHEFFSNKKQAVESIIRPAQAENVDFSLWNNPSSCQSMSAFTDQLFDPESMGTCDLSDKTTSCSDTRNMNGGRAGSRDQFGNSSSTNLAMSRDIDLSICGTRKINASQVWDSGDGFATSIVQPLTIGENDLFSSIAYQRSENCTVPQLTYRKENINATLPVTSFSKAETNAISSSQILAKGNDDPLLLGHQHGRKIKSVLSSGLPYNNWNSNLMPVCRQYRKEAGSFTSNVPEYDREHETILFINHTYHKPAEMAIGSSFDKSDDVISTVGPTQNKDNTIVSKGIIYDNQNSNVISVGQNYEEGLATAISFEAETSDLSVRLLSSSDLLIRQSLEKSAKGHTTDNLMEPNVSQDANAASLSNIADSALISKKQKKTPTSNFPANVKSMLSTGIFDGVPVKYVSWSREKNLHGVVKGTGYLCGCKDCNQTKALNAYEFERHAGGKTKHPNNHIFFENGKSVYAAVQELKSTPQEMLFEAIENVTGSKINQKNFRIWKVSYQAATRELERIYGKDEAAKLL